MHQSTSEVLHFKASLYHRPVFSILLPSFLSAKSVLPLLLHIPPESGVRYFRPLSIDEKP